MVDLFINVSPPRGKLNIHNTINVLSFVSIDNKTVCVTCISSNTRTRLTLN